jgi:hypothetical protein
MSEYKGSEGGRGLERASRAGNALFGLILVGLGFIFLLGMLFDVHIGDFVWPFLVIVPGVVLVVLALAVGDPAGEPMAMLGSLATMVGLILFYQNTTGHWASWTYAWALVAPTSLGIGQWLYGQAKGREKMVQSGKNIVKAGVAIFLVAAVFFELILGVSGFGAGRYFWPVALIALGLLLLARNFIPGLRRS